MTATRLPRGVWIEHAFIILFVVTGIQSVLFTFEHHYLPQPFFFVTSDTYMDWFNTAWWARKPGMYDDWRSVYPPLSFVLLLLSGLPKCYVDTDILVARDCDWFGIFVMHAVFVLNIVLTAKTFLKIDRRTALPRSLAVSAGMPMLFGLDRGNVILFCYTFVLLGFGPLLRSARWRWLFVGLAVNLKVYLIGALAALLLKRRWLWLEGCVLATVAVYLVSFAIIGAGTPLEIYANLVNFAEEFKPDAVSGAYYANTFISVLNALKDPMMPANALLGSRGTEIGIVLLTTIMRASQGMIALAAIATWLRPEVVPNYRVVMFGIAFAMISQETGAYTSPILLLLIFMEPWKGIARPMALISAYALCLPGDIRITYLSSLNRDSFFFVGPVLSEQYLTVGMIVRPLLFTLMPVCLACLTLRDVYKDVRYQGWSSRWRFRHDTPMLPGIMAPSRAEPGQQAYHDA